jgi:hypothetical protein
VCLGKGETDAEIPVVDHTGASGEPPKYGNSSGAAQLEIGVV